MSLRQVKKIITQNKKPEVKDEDDEQEDEEKPRFSKFVIDSDEEEPESSESEEEKKVPTESEEQKTPTPTLNTKLKNKKRSEQKNADFDFSELIKEEQKSSLSHPQLKISNIEPCLKRNPKHFDSSNELQKMFHEKSKPKPTSHKKTFILTPGIQKGPMKINYLPTMDVKNSEFSFDMSKGYLKLYQDYVFCVESNDPGMLHDFSNKYPFHIEALYQLCLIYKMQAKYEQVYQILERILYVFQLSFHHQFSPIGRGIHMNMNKSSLNRIFFRSIFMFADCLGRKGCYRTALEFVKLLLCLDYKDPLGGLLLIDFYSLATKKYNYLIGFCSNFMNEYYKVEKVLAMPSMIYSLALAKALAENDFNVTEKDTNKAFEISTLDKLANESASIVLLCAVATFPAIAKSLLQRLAPSFNFFIESEEKEGVYDYSALAEIYAVRNLELWRNDLCINWLKQAVEEADIIGWKENNEIWDYSHLDINDFCFVAKNLIPQDMAFK